MSRKPQTFLLLLVVCMCAAVRAQSPRPQSAPVKLPAGVTLDDGLSEDEAVAIALWNNAALQFDLAQLGLAQADLIEAGLLRNPTLQVLLPLGFQQFEMLASLPSEVLWQRKRRVAAAKLEYDRIAKSLEQNGLNLARDVRVAYVNLALAEARKRVADQAVQLRGEIVRITNARLRLGDISELEASAVQVELATAEEQRVRFARDIDLAQERLKFLLGDTQRALSFRIAPPAPQDAPIIPASITIAAPVAGTTAAPVAGDALDALLADAFAHRPDLRAAELAIEAAAARAKWERSRLFSLAALLSIKRGEGLGFSPRPGFSAELPIFHRNQGGIARADADVARASKQYLSVKEQIAAEVREAFVQYQQAREALAVYRARLLPQTQAAVALAEQSYRRGEQPYLFVLETSRQAVDARLREAELQADIERATAQLTRSIGRKHDNQSR